MNSLDALGFLKNPGTWVVLALLIAAEWGNIHASNEVERLCDLTGDHDFTVSKPVTARQQIDNICAGHAEEDDTDDDGDRGYAAPGE